MTDAYEVPPRDPARGYLVARLETLHEFSVNGVATEEGTCGGLERGDYFGIEGNWTDDAGVTHEWPAATPYVTANASGTACSAVPARPTTWGAIKG